LELPQKTLHPPTHTNLVHPVNYNTLQMSIPTQHIERIDKEMKKFFSFFNEAFPHEEGRPNRGIPTYMRDEIFMYFIADGWRSAGKPNVSKYYAMMQESVIFYVFCFQPDYNSFRKTFARYKDKKVWEYQALSVALRCLMNQDKGYDYCIQQLIEAPESMDARWKNDIVKSLDLPIALRKLRNESKLHHDKEKNKEEGLSV